jgi:hypothetical protein
MKVSTGRILITVTGTEKELEDCQRTLSLIGVAVCQLCNTRENNSPFLVVSFLPTEQIAANKLASMAKVFEHLAGPQSEPYDFNANQLDLLADTPAPQPKPSDSWMSGKASSDPPDLAPPFGRGGAFDCP